jgi:glycosyltransferase involved in cell wall biosynthesis
MNVLYLDHTSLVSGAQRALLDLLEVLPPSVTPTVACPTGPLGEAISALGIRVVELPGTSGSLRLHPTQTIRALGEIAGSAVALRQAIDASAADVVHANSLRAGLIAGAANLRGRTPTVVHIHDVLPSTWAAVIVRRLLQMSADAVITVSHFTSENFGVHGRRPPVYMLHNPLDTVRFDPQAITKGEAREALGISDDVKLVGVVAQITPWKGQDVAILAFQKLSQRFRDARLIIVGEAKFVKRATRFDNLEYLTKLRRLVDDLGLQSRVEFWGEREDTPRILRALDVLLAPSWAEPFGRSVVEAMALETPVIATNVGGPAEYIEDQVDGLVLPPRDVQRWASALDRLLGEPGRRNDLGARASHKVRASFERQLYGDRVLKVYESLLAGESRAPRARSGAQSGGRRARRRSSQDRAGRDAPLRVLVVEHTSAMGGAQHSLLELLRTIAKKHEVTLACPKGPLADAAQGIVSSIAVIPESQVSYKLHARETPRELMRAATAARAIRRHGLRLLPDVVHANSLRAGLLVIGARPGAPLVVHCRDLMPDGRVARGLSRLVLRRSTSVVAVSRSVAARLAGPDWAAQGVLVVDNPVDFKRFDPARIGPPEVRRELGIDGSPVIGVLAQITPWKGQKRAVHTLHALRSSHPNAQLVLAGEAKFVSASTRFDNLKYERELHQLVSDLELSEAVRFLGERHDPERILAALDVLLVPSSEEPFGRTVIEALAMEVPVVATLAGGPRDVIRAGLDGVVLPHGDTTAWADAVCELYRSGRNAGSRAYAASRFAPARHAAIMVDVYRRATAVAASATTAAKSA